MGGDKSKRRKAPPGGRGFRLARARVRDAAFFLGSEEGKVVKKDVLKAAVVLRLMGAAPSDDPPVPAQRNNYLHNSGGVGSHVSHGPHGSHGSGA